VAPARSDSDCYPDDTDTQLQRTGMYSGLQGILGIIQVLSDASRSTGQRGVQTEQSPVILHDEANLKVEYTVAMALQH
jgi:hypothetical protein